MRRLKKNDTVLVLSGKDKGKKGKVLRVFPDGCKVIVEGVALVKKHQKPSQKFKGGIIDRPMAIAGDKVMLVCPRCNKPTRINGSRICKKCQELVDKN